MELALYINEVMDYKGRKVSDYHWGYGTSDSNGAKAAYDKMFAKLEELQITEFALLYFGSEFCEYKLPSQKDLDQFISIYAQEKMTPVFVTPPVTDWGIEKLRSDFDHLASWYPEMGIVVNDLGVLELLHSEYPRFKRIAGRVLDKLSHDSRVTSSELNIYYGQTGLQYARNPGIISRASRSVLSDYEIERYEFDIPKTGIQLEVQDMPFSLYWPYHYLTTGRVCLLRALEYDGADKFLVGSRSCRQDCRGLEIELRKPVNGFRIENGKKVDNDYLFQSGNTLYYLFDQLDLGTVLKSFQRVIIQIL